MEAVGFAFISSDFQCLCGSDRRKEQEHKQDKVKGLKELSMRLSFDVI